MKPSWDDSTGLQLPVIPRFNFSARPRQFAEICASVIYTKSLTGVVSQAYPALPNPPNMSRTYVPRSLLAVLCFALLLSQDAAAQTCLAPDFKVELIYGVPEIEHPSVVTCDDDGNLFVGEDPMDMRGPTKKEFDRVVRIEFGTDGKPTKKTVFCENLAAVFGLVWHDGALYVMHAPHYSVFRDTNGDGVADERKDLATGFGPPAGVYGFNDHIVTGTRLGLDGRVYVSVGDKGVPKAVGADGSTITLEGGGVVRMRLDGTELEVVTSGTRNHLDVAMDSLDNIFTYDNTDDGLGWWTRFTHHVPTGYYGYPYDYHPHPERHLPRISEHGGGSPVGADVYREAAWPKSYVDSPFFCEWGKGKVQRFKLTKKRASFESVIEDFLVPDKSGEPFRPQDICFSPDGKHMYLADWNFGGWVNPAVKGRLYRITYTGSEPAVKEEPPRMKHDSSVEDIVKSLGHPSHAERLRAQLAIAANGGGAVATASNLITQPETSSLTKIHAIWAGHVYFNTVIPGTAKRAAATYDPRGQWLAALQDPDGAVRSQAARALGMSGVKSAAESLGKLLISDPEPTVRLQTAIALGRIGDPQPDAKWKSEDAGQAGVILPRTDDKTMAPLKTGEAEIAAALYPALADEDQYVRHTAMQALRVINQWQDAPKYLVDSKTQAGTLLALTGVYDEAAIQVLQEVAFSNKSPEAQATAVAALAEVTFRAAPYEKGWWGTQPARGKPARAKNQTWNGTSVIQNTLRDVLQKEDSAPAAKLAVIKAWSASANAESFPLLRALVETNKNAELSLAAVATLAASKDAESISLFAKIAGDKDRPDALRQEAIRGITAIGSPAAIKQLADIVAAGDSSEALVLLSLDALGALKANDAREVVEKRIADKVPAVRAAALTSYSKIAGKDSASRIAAVLLEDLDGDVRKAALASLASLKVADTIPAIVKVAADKRIQFEAQLALTTMPDRRALGLYLDGLTSKNQQLREASLNALLAIRPQIEDDILTLHKQQELPKQLLAPLQTVFSAPASIKKWDVLGSFPKDGDKLPQLDFAAAPDKDQIFHVGDRSLQWKSIEVNDADGKVSPANQVAGPRDSAWVFGYIPVEVDAAGPRTLVVGSDDQLTVWVNGKQVYEFTGNRGWSKNGGQSSAEFQKGMNHVYLKCGNDTGPWDFSLAMSVRDPKFAFLFENVPATLDLEAFREFALKNAGNAIRGQEIFNNKEGVGCIKCHAVAATGGKVGPDLLGIGVRYPKDELIRSILEPSARIANGYDTGIILSADGQVITGIIKLDSPEAVELMTADGKTVRIAADDIEKFNRSPVSTMPNGIKDGLTLQDFADIVAYLESLKGM